MAFSDNDFVTYLIFSSEVCIVYKSLVLFTMHLGEISIDGDGLMKISWYRRFADFFELGSLYKSHSKFVVGVLAIVNGDFYLDIFSIIDWAAIRNMS